MEIEEMRKRKQILKHDIVTLLNTFTEETGASIFSLGIEDKVYQMGVPIRVASISLEVTFIIMTETKRSGYGNKDGSQKGLKSGGSGRNQTTQCRHPVIKKRR